MGVVDIPQIYHNYAYLLQQAIHLVLSLEQTTIYSNSSSAKTPHNRCGTLEEYSKPHSKLLSGGNVLDQINHTGAAREEIQNQLNRNLDILLLAGWNVRFKCKKIRISITYNPIHCHTTKQA